MAKTAKKTSKKVSQPKANKYDITVKTQLTADELFKLAINTAIKKDKPKKK